MKLPGVRVHLTGSASAKRDGSLLGAANHLVAHLTGQLVDHGAGLVLGVAGEPRGENGPYVFDWTALHEITGKPDPAPGWPESRAARFIVVASQRGLEKIPKWREDVWNILKNRTDFDLKITPAGWKMASLIRREQTELGDVLIVLGGGAGAERLAQLYTGEGKPVIPISSNLGALSEDGRGGGSYLHEEALSETEGFFQLVDGAGSATARLAGLKLASESDVEPLSKEVLLLIENLRPRRAFYVRLMAGSHDEYDAVEKHFRDVIDPVMEDLGLEPHEVGRQDPIAAFINVEIFEGIHRAGAVVVDLTGVRPNCMMELGYALGRRRNVVISAKIETALPFDTDKLPTYFWNEQDTALERQQSFREWFNRYIGLPSIVD